MSFLFDLDIVFQVAHLVLQPVPLEVIDLLVLDTQDGPLRAAVALSHCHESREDVRGLKGQPGGHPRLQQRQGPCQTQEQVRHRGLIIEPVRESMIVSDEMPAFSGIIIYL